TSLHQLPLALPFLTPTDSPHRGERELQCELRSSPRAHTVPPWASTATVPGPVPHGGTHYDPSPFLFDGVLRSVLVGGVGFDARHGAHLGVGVVHAVLALQLEGGVGNLEALADGLFDMVADGLGFLQCGVTAQYDVGGEGPDLTGEAPHVQVVHAV